MALLQAVKDGDNDSFKLLLPDCDLSIEDEDGRNPLLLAAHLGNRDMVQTLLTDERCAHPKLPINGFSDSTEFSHEDGTQGNHVKTNKFSQFGFKTTDKLGRTVLHYCAEFGMYDAATILLVSVSELIPLLNGDVKSHGTRQPWWLYT